MGPRLSSSHNASQTNVKSLMLCRKSRGCLLKHEAPQHESCLGTIKCAVNGTDHRSTSVIPVSLVARRVFARDDKHRTALYRPRWHTKAFASPPFDSVRGVNKRGLFMRGEGIDYLSVFQQSIVDHDSGKRSESPQCWWVHMGQDSHRPGQTCEGG